MKSRLFYLILIPMLLCSACTNITNLNSSGASDISSASIVESTSSESEETLKEFSNAKLENKTFDYDGKAHSLVLTGAPKDAMIEYTNNNQVDVGVYTVTATVSKQGYKTKTFSAILTIKGKTIIGVTFEDQVFSYDGYPHSIYVENAPKDASIDYEGNGKISIGTYKVTATITAKGYEKLVLTATLTISNLSLFPDYSLPNCYWIYDDKDVNLKIYFEDYEYYLDRDYWVDYDVNYKVNGVITNEPIIRDVGTYSVSAIYSADGYSTKTISFNVTISDTIGGIDSSKTAFLLDENTKFQDLYNEFIKGNYSVYIENYDEYDRDLDGIYEDVVKKGNVSNYFVTPEAFAGRRNENSMLYCSKDYFITKGSKYAFNTVYDYFSQYKYKFPAEDYLENVISISDGMAPFAFLEESDNGGFINSKVGGYHNVYGTYEIDSINNRFIITARDHYYHEPTFNHDEVSQFVFYNIGNTKVTIPDSLKGSDDEASSYELDEFVRNGIYYSRYDSGFMADVTINEFDDAFLGGGIYTLEPEFEGIPIKCVDYSVYYYAYYVDETLYDLNVYYDNSGYYQGDYTEFGFVKYYRDASKFGALHYYGEWVY